MDMYVLFEKLTDSIYSLTSTKNNENLGFCLKMYIYKCNLARNRKRFIKNLNNIFSCWWKPNNTCFQTKEKERNLLQKKSLKICQKNEEKGKAKLDE